MIKELENLFFLFIVFFLPFQVALNFTPGADVLLGRVFIVLLFFLFLLRKSFEKDLSIPLDFSSVLIYVFLFLAAISLFWAENKIFALRKLLFLFSIFPLFFIALEKLRDRALVRNSLRLVSWSAVLAAVLGILQFGAQFVFGSKNVLFFWKYILGPIFYGRSFSGEVFQYPSFFVNISGRTLMRAAFPFPDPHSFAFFLGLSLPLVFYYFFFVRRRQAASRALPFSVLGCLTIALALTFSRGGYLALLTAFFWALLVFWRFMKGKTRLIILSSLLVFFVLFLFIPNPVLLRLKAAFNLYEGSNLGRLHNWQEAISIVAARPFSGVGLGNYSYFLNPSLPYRTPLYAHNLYLDIASELGIFAALAFFLLLFGNILRILFFSRSKPLKNCACALFLSASLVFFSVHSLFDTSLYSTRVLPLLLLILALLETIFNKSQKGSRAEN